MYLFVEDIAKKLKKSPEEINKKLVDLGLQEKGNYCYTATKEGRKISERHQFFPPGGRIYFIKWRWENVKPLIK